MLRTHYSFFATRSDQSTGGGSSANNPPPLRPQDEAPPGTPGTGENICRQCGGTGRQDSHPCPACEGTGIVITGIGGA